MSSGGSDSRAATRATISSMAPEGGACGTVAAAPEAGGVAATTRAATTVSATFCPATGCGVTTTLLTSFPVRGSPRTTLTIRAG